MKPEELNSILQKGILAPSADNMQPWKFRVHGEAVDLHLSFHADRHFCEIGLKFLYASMGGVIENIRVAALSNGYKATPLYFPNREDPTFVAQIRFERASRQGHPHYSVLDQRVTNRKFYFSGRLIEHGV